MDRLVESIWYCYSGHRSVSDVCQLSKRNERFLRNGTAACPRLRKLRSRVGTLAMVIRITKEGGLYSANVTPPDSETLWRSPHPMTAKELFDNLRKIGCNPMDIWDAFKMSDPNLTHL